ncbi:MAG: hypothetical protein JHC96_07860 [Brevundimonas sp.]|uniref:hypothetical protein n=1 Tax=Brevundimonas sp. TaxID=1871086 RepID=UPI001A1EA508|nr:hypothetical protein [Brevundimonas sp.]MBJ7318698.1 hypothetical protein [Brevundimonas sp.]
MSRLTLSKMSDAEAVVQEAQTLEWETRCETERWSDAAEDRSSAEGFEESQSRYRELRAAAEAMVAILYRMQEPLLTDPYATWAAKLMVKARGLLTDIEDGELVEKISFVSAGSDKE